MKREVLAVLMMLLVGLTSAVSVDVTVVDNAGSYSGAILRLKASEDGELGEKVYPDSDKYLKAAGVLKFEVETSLSEVFFNVVFTKDGAKVKEIDKGPFDVNGSEIYVDLRDIKELDVIKKTEVEVEENVSEMESNESNETVVEVDVVDEDSEEDGYLVEMTGWVMQNVDSYGNVVYYSLGGFVLLVLVIVLIVMLRRRKKKGDIVDEKEEKKEVEEIADEEDEEDLELKEVEERVKATEAKISKLKSGAKKRKKIEDAKKKLAEEEAELKKLEGEGAGKKEIEAQKKDVREAVEKVEDLDSF